MEKKTILLVSILASFVVFLDGSIVNVALPAITRELGGGLATQQWVVDAYLITLGAIMLIAGSVSDLFGRKRVLNVGLIAFGITSLFCALAPNAPFIIISRGLQGLAGALIVPSSLALIMSSFEGREKGKAIGTWTAWTGTAFIVGSLVGGLIVDTMSWRLIFGINIVPILVTLFLFRASKDTGLRSEGVTLDGIGAILCALGLGLPVYALIEQAHLGWQNPLIFLPLLLGLMIFAFFLVYESRTKHPMLPLSLFHNRNFAVGNIATFSIYAGLAVASFLITIFVQQVGHYTGIQAGLALLPVTIIMFFFSSRFGALADKFGPRLFMTIGPALAGFGFLLMLSTNQSVNYWTQLFPGVLLFAIGLCTTVTPLTAAILGSIETKRSGIASAVNNAVARIAGLIAIACIGVVTGPQIDLAGFHRGIILIAVLLFIGSVISGLGIQNLQHKKE